ncbi:hypothetical protein QAD02_000340 [Eretmocerus hayati]|uniref:Uncharacterized protein n=1 Tax=Eretmocerus hayati TaxID=131215 RepID=A0ACC2NDC6_9HYME|nr:hypothetical protein QAD02_000340 [Eretmocerus hayati]
MGRLVLAEERLLSYLESLSRPDAYSVGLILGQSTAQKDFVIHLAKTLPASNAEVVEEPLLTPVTETPKDTSEDYIKSVKDIDINLVADHAKHVTRMLPGGMSVLGIFIVGPEDCLNNSAHAQKLRTVLSAIHKSLASNSYLYGISDHENLILGFNSVTKLHVCKSVDVSSGGILKPADWKFQKKITTWHHLEALVDFDHLFPVPDDMHPHTLERQLQSIVERISEMVNNALVVIEDEPKSPEDVIESFATKKNLGKGEEGDELDEVLQVGVHVPCSFKEKSNSIKTISCSASMRLMGQLVSKTALHQRATVKEATSAVRQDILRSLASRLELHLNSVIEEENGSPEENVTLHEPPRRVLFELPINKVTLSDYLFPGEEPTVSLVLLHQLLDIEVQEDQIQKDAEKQVDPSEFYCQNEVKTKPIDQGKEPKYSSNFTLYIASIVIAFLFAILGILIYQLSTGKRN